MLEELTTDVLVVGGGTGGTAAALQSARRGAKTILVSEFSWLGGMLTSAGVPAPDGNELQAFQTGIWRSFLEELQRRQPQGVHQAWVSFFTYDPRLGAQIFADWAQAEPNLRWISGYIPLAVGRTDDRLTWVEFADFRIRAHIIIDATELGDLLAFAEVPHRWGWELQAEWDEPSAPIAPNDLTNRYPVQAPTWIGILQDFGEGEQSPEIPLPPDQDPKDHQFVGAWEHYGPEQFLNYGRLPSDRFMLNWPQQGNDYGEDLHRLIQSPQTRQSFFQESLWHTQRFLRHIQSQLGRRYGLATAIFPKAATLSAPGKFQFSPGGGAYALHPYFRESRRLQGLTTIREQDILPISGGTVATLPIDSQGNVTAIALGNYPNDHHYPNHDWPVQPKTIRWGGRWTGTPFTIPYAALISETVDGLLVCEKNISVSHIANGATRLQPTVLGIGQAAGMAAALCIEQNCQPRELAIAPLQQALLTDAIAPLAVIPLFNLSPRHPDWLHWQQHYLKHPETYPIDGSCPNLVNQASDQSSFAQPFHQFTTPPTNWTGLFIRLGEQNYNIHLTHWSKNDPKDFNLVTLNAHVNQVLINYPDRQPIHVLGYLNTSGHWLLAESVLTTGNTDQSTSDR